MKPRNLPCTPTPKSQQRGAHGLRRHVLTTVWMMTGAVALVAVQDSDMFRPIHALVSRPVGVRGVQKRCHRMSFSPASPQSSPISNNDSIMDQNSNLPATRYTIDNSVCPPTQPDVLEASVQKACRCLPLYLEKRPIASHTKQAFDTFLRRLSTDLDLPGKNADLPKTILATFPSGIILDSGCGTGRSTRLLSETYPEHLILGIDRSIARLTKTKNNQKAEHSYNFYDDGSTTITDQTYVHGIARNAYLIRAELVDFWRCCIDHNADFWTNYISHHYLLYPNPYPTPQRLTQRWYAHPSFPLLLQLNAHHLVIRSNWEGYLWEFSVAVKIASEYFELSSIRSAPNGNPALPYLDSANGGPHERTDKLVSWTNFEAKYDNIGERTYELVLERQEQG